MRRSGNSLHWVSLTLYIIYWHSFLWKYKCFFSPRRDSSIHQGLNWSPIRKICRHLVLVLLVDFFSSPYSMLKANNFRFYGDSEFVPSDYIISVIAKYVCKGIGGRFCDYFVMLIMGTDSDQLAHNRMDVYMGHIPAGTSTMNFMYFFSLPSSSLFWVKVDD